MIDTARVRTETGTVRRAALALVAVGGLTGLELLLGRTNWAGWTGWTAAYRFTSFCGLLFAKVGLMLSVVLPRGPRGVARRLVPLAFALAAGFAVVLMIEAAFRGRVR